MTLLKPDLSFYVLFTPKTENIITCIDILSVKRYKKRKKTRFTRKFFSSQKRHNKKSVYITSSLRPLHTPQ